MIAAGWPGTWASSSVGRTVSVLRELIDQLQELPGIGPKSAERIGYWIVRQPPDAVRALASAIESSAQGISPCGECGHVDETDRRVVTGVDGGRGR